MTISTDAQELALYIENSGELYERAMKPTQRNLAAKKARGVYDHELAIVAFTHVAKLGAKLYERENGDGTWHFSPKQIKEAAKELADGFEAEWKGGAYRELLPQKYQAKPTTTKKPKKIKLDIREYTLPAHWAPALINGDTTGMSDADEAEMDAWLERVKPGHAVDADDERFSHRNDATSLGGDVMTFKFQKV